jgi:hypothetical protein
VIERINGKFTVINPTTGDIIGRYASIEEAQAALARFAGQGTGSPAPQPPQPRPQGLGMGTQGQLPAQGSGLGMSGGAPQGGGGGILELLQALLGGRGGVR